MKSFFFIILMWPQDNFSEIIILPHYLVLLVSYPNTLLTGSSERRSAVYSPLVPPVPHSPTPMQSHVSPKRRRGAENYSQWAKVYLLQLKSILTQKYSKHLSRAITREPATQMCFPTTPPQNPPNPPSDQTAVTPQGASQATTNSLVVDETQSSCSPRLLRISQRKQNQNEPQQSTPVLVTDLWGSVPTLHASSLQ